MRQRLSSPCAVAVALVLAGSAAARAQGVSLSRAGSGARAAGMADAFVAVSDDGTAASWNPAGLAQLRQPELSLVYVVSQRGVRLSGLRSPDDLVAYAIRPNRSTSSSVDFASAALPFSLARKPVTVQVGWQRIYQLTNVIGGDVDRYLTSRPDARVGSSFFEDRLTGNIDVVSVAGAVKLTTRTAIGASLEFWRGSWTNRVSIIEDAEPEGRSAFADFNNAVRIRGHTATVGLLLTYPSWNAGLVYHAPFWSSFRPRTKVTSTAAPPQVAETSAARFRLPRSIAAGAAWRVAPRWTASAAVTHDQWTDALIDRLPDTPGAINFFDGAPPALSTSRDTVSVNVGAEHLFVRDTGVVPLRFGLGWEPQGAVDRVTRDPLEYVLVSGGAGYNTNRIKFDAAVQYRWGASRAAHVFTVDSVLTTGPDAVGRTASHEWRLKFSAIYRIQDTQKLRGILRRIFG